jgi:hypothetical protein
MIQENKKKKGNAWWIDSWHQHEADMKARNPDSLIAVSQQFLFLQWKIAEEDTANQESVIIFH